MNINFITLGSSKSTGFFSNWLKPKSKDDEGSKDIELATQLNLKQEKFALTAFRDQYEYDSETWMSRMTHARMWEIVLPCSHDSFSYKIKNFIPSPIKIFIQTQNYSIAD